MKLSELIRDLYKLTENLNLYICIYCEKNKPDFVRLKKEVIAIKQIISDIEKEMNL